MGWIQILAETYDKCKSEVGKISYVDNKLLVLLPIAHSINNSDIEIMLNEEAEILDVKKLAKEEQQTIMPVTEDSQARSSGIAPMPLCDNISYLAGDYKDYSKETKKYERYEQYIKELELWAKDKDSNKDIKVIYAYLNKKKLISDLLKYSLYESVEELIEMKGMIRFKVKYKNELVKCSFEDSEVFDNYVNYYRNKIKKMKRNIDYVSGEEDYIAEKLPSKIRNTADGARLISSNDTNGYTYRGRFDNAMEAASISYVLSQKAHNVLKWLIQKQGYKNGSEVILIFGVSEDAEIINPLKVDMNIELCEEVDTNEKYAKEVNKAIRGLCPISEKSREKVVAICLDTADGAPQGRLSITYYNEFDKSEFRDNVEKWYNECAWILYLNNTYKKGTPNIRDIINVAYGIEGSEGYLKVTNENLFKKTIDRLLPCIVQHKKIPKDIVVAAVNNLNNPMSTSNTLFDKKIRVTCALIRKYCKDYKKEDVNMALDRDNNNRSYLFGRLLALTDEIESYAIYKEGGGRETNAKRYWSIYKRKPASTFDLLRDKLQPYLNKLNKGLVYKYENEIAEILEKLSKSNSFNNNQLNEQYILGYYLQIDELKNNIKQNKMGENENE